jgi:hypothetical protein
MNRILESGRHLYLKERKYLWQNYMLITPSHLLNIRPPPQQVRRRLTHAFVRVHHCSQLKVELSIKPARDAPFVPLFLAPIACHRR